LMQLGPYLVTGLPHHEPETGTGVPQGGHEQAGFAVALAAENACGRALAVVHLHLLAGQEGQAIELLRLLVAQLCAEAFDRIVLASKAVLVDQVLVDGHGVALQTQLSFDELAPGFAQGGGSRPRGNSESRWPGWGSLTGHSLRAGGHPGAVCPFCGKALLVGADGVTRNSRDLLDLSLAGVGP